MLYPCLVAPLALPLLELHPLSFSTGDILYPLSLVTIVIPGLLRAFSSNPSYVLARLARCGSVAPQRLVREQPSTVRLDWT